MMYTDPNFSPTMAQNSKLHESGMVSCQRKAGNEIAKGRCLLMKKEDKKPCAGCPHLRKKHKVDQLPLEDTALHSKWDKLEAEKEQKREEDKAQKATKKANKGKK